MKKIKNRPRSLAFTITTAIVVLLLVFGLIVSEIGYESFTNSLTREYRDTALQVAKTATSIINGDRIDEYLESGGEDEEWAYTNSRLDLLCNNMQVTMIYVIRVDTSDYGRFESVFNNIIEGNEDYTPWEVGHKRDTTNEEYAEIYRALYEGEREEASIERTSQLNGKEPHITALVPVKGSQGVTAILCVQLPMSELVGGRRFYVYSAAISTAVMLVLAAFSTVHYLKKKIIKPINKVTDEAHRFASENTRGENLENISSIYEINDLANSINKMEGDMVRYIKNLTGITAEKERISAELNVAKSIQKNSVPNVFPPFPDRDDFDIFAYMNPAKEVGGDFYNFFLVDEDHLAIVIADVSGKGVPAALFMMVTNILISDRTLMGGTPAQILEFVNKNICEHNPADMFVTVWLGIIEISTGKIIAANAGHDDPAVYRKNGKFEIVKNKHGLVIGAFPTVKYTDFELQLNKGDKIFLYTDGLPEATDSDNRMFSLDRMVETLNNFKDQNPENILKGVNESVDSFVGDAPQFDDLTMMCIELNEKNDMRKLTVDATNDNLHEVIAFVDGILEENDCSPRVQMQLDLAVEEVFVNIANYAYPESTGKAEISVGVDSGEVTIELRDSGIKYDPLAKSDPDVTLSANEREIGGLGIFLTKKNTDSISYKYENGQNVLTMTKKIG